MTFDNQRLIFTLMDIVANIKAIRLQKSINQEVLAEALGVDVSAISNIEKGKRELRVSELEKIANCLGVDVTYLITYPKKYVDSDMVKSSEKVSVTFEVSPENREHLLKLITGK